jgi:hypothetical protein
MDRQLLDWWIQGCWCWCSCCLIRTWTLPHTTCQLLICYLLIAKMHWVWYTIARMAVRQRRNGRLVGKLLGKLLGVPCNTSFMWSLSWAVDSKKGIYYL